MKKLIAAVAVAALAVAMTGCKEKTASEKLQDKVVAALEATAEAAKKTAEAGKVGDKFEEIGDKIEEAGD